MREYQREWLLKARTLAEIAERDRLRSEPVCPRDPALAAHVAEHGNRKQRRAMAARARKQEALK